MKRLLIIASLLLSMMACKDSGNTKSDENSDQNSSEISTDADDENQTSGNYGMEDTSEASKTKNGDTVQSDATSTDSIDKTFLAGKFIKTDHTSDSDCSCYCVNINFSGTSELCLSENKLYINARMEKSGDKINVYYSGKTAKTSNTEIPWDKFDTSVSIAEIKPEADGGLKLDWKGFTIDGKIAVDYALYGKKTLEGTYKKL